MKNVSSGLKTETDTRAASPDTDDVQRRLKSDLECDNLSEILDKY